MIHLSNKPDPSNEFIILMASITALAALAVDMMLPALTIMGRDLKVQSVNNSQLIVSFIFLGMSIGQIFFGPLSDSLGRKPPIYFGLILFNIGCIISIFANNLPLMLLGRVIQGFGLGAPRILVIAVIRDKYSGNAMARIMSFIFMVFILIPTIAPAMGQAILNFVHWRAIFIMLLIFSTILFFWFMFRQTETLAKDKRTAFSFAHLADGIRQVVRNPHSLGYTIASGFIFSAFLGYLNSSQQIFQEQYGLGNLFPLFFAIISLSIGLASAVNAKLVMRFGMVNMSKGATYTIFITSFIFFGYSMLWNGHPPLWQFMIYLVITLFSNGILIGNMNSLAMEPLGKIAGIGAAFVGSLSMVVALPLGILIGNCYNGTVYPLIAGYGVFGGLFTLAAIKWVNIKSKSQTLN